MDSYYKVLSIAGSDSSGGAGIQADIKTCSAIGVYGMTAITAITAQNTTRVTGVMPVPPEYVSKQIDAVFADIRPDAVKIGMLANSSIIDVVAERLEFYMPQNIILDPVMVSTSGCKLIDDDAINSMITRLLPITTLVTPNRHEAAIMARQEITGTPENILQAARSIIVLGAKAVLIKGGHFDDKSMTDYLLTAQEPDNLIGFKSFFIDTPNTHGTGCTYSSAIASYLALGYDLYDSIKAAKQYLTGAIAAGAGITIGKGHGPVNHLYNPSSLKIHK